MSKLLSDVPALDLVVLSAGILGEIRNLTETPLEELKQVMEVNLWANKAVMDWLHAWGGPIDQIVMISSGAVVLGNKDDACFKRGTPRPCPGRWKQLSG